MSFERKFRISKERIEDRLNEEEGKEKKKKLEKIKKGKEKKKW